MGDLLIDELGDRRWLCHTTTASSDPAMTLQQWFATLVAEFASRDGRSHGSSPPKSDSPSLPPSKNSNRKTSARSISAS